MEKELLLLRVGWEKSLEPFTDSEISSLVAVVLCVKKAELLEWSRSPRVSFQPTACDPFAWSPGRWCLIRLLIYPKESFSVRFSGYQ